MTLSLSPFRYVPGLALASAVAGAAFALERLELVIWSRAWLEPLVLAIILGAILRSIIALPKGTSCGIHMAAKPVMEVAVALMGASVSLTALGATGLRLIGGIAVMIALTIVLGYRIGRWLGLCARMAMLVACGNAICGNSAIAAVAPAINADGEDVAAAVGFTAVMGIGVVLAVAPIAMALHLSPVQGGMLAGMTVYAVPQVLAAASPLGGVAVQVGAVVKLVRVLMLGPVVTVLAAMHGAKGPLAPRARLSQFVPGFILAFLGLAALRSFGAIPDALARAAHQASLWLTLVAMAGLGLGVDLRRVGAAGVRVTASVTLSLAVLFAGAIAVIHMLG